MGQLDGPRFKMQLFASNTASLANCDTAGWGCVCQPTLEFASLRGEKMLEMQLNFDASLGGALLTEGDCCSRCEVTQPPSAPPYMRPPRLAARSVP